jgi:hypothetical protein
MDRVATEVAQEMSSSGGVDELKPSNPKLTKIQNRQRSSTAKRSATPKSNLKKVPRNPHNQRKLAIDWTVVEQEYVGGRLEEDKESGFPKRLFPSLRLIADRYGIPFTAVAWQARSRNWAKRRDRMREQLQHQFDSELIRSRDSLLTESALTLDKFLKAFERAVEADAVPRASIADFERALKLQAWLRDEKAGTGTSSGVDLSELQERHATTKRQALELDPSMTGLISSREEREASAVTRTPDPPKPLSRDWYRLLRRTERSGTLTAHGPAPCDASAFFQADFNDRFLL